MAAADDLWTRVSAIEAALRDAGRAADADRLSAASTMSVHPGEVWPATLAVLRDIACDPPPTIDPHLVRRCVEDLARWP